MKQNNLEIERYRLTAEKLMKRGWNLRYASSQANGNNGLFHVPTKAGTLHILASDGSGWEHVSVSVYKKNRCPTWEEMCLVKDLFWGEDETVIQYHPAKSDYVNMHEYTLHLWRPTAVEIYTPPPILVGLQKGVTHP